MQSYSSSCSLRVKPLRLASTLPSSHLLCPLTLSKAILDAFFTRDRKGDAHDAFVGLLQGSKSLIDYHMKVLDVVREYSEAFGAQLVLSPAMVAH